MGGRRMTVKELKNNLNHYDDDAEIEFTLNQEIEIDSWKENKYGMKYVEIDKKLDICFIGGTYDAPWIDLELLQGGQRKQRWRDQ
jgi:hypothetical protein